MKCEVCGKTIRRKKIGSKYCSAYCVGRAKRERAKEREFLKLNGMETACTENEQKTEKMKQTVYDELRTVEKENFNTILELRASYDEKMLILRDLNLKQDFKIQSLEKEILDLNSKHSQQLEDASKSTTKDTVQAITQMPAIQTALGALAGNIIPSTNTGLNGVDGYSTQEKQIIDAIRRMQPDAQAHLCQMLYVLFAKTDQEQMEIFTSLQAFMTQPNEEDDI